MTSIFEIFHPPKQANSIQNTGHFGFQVELKYHKTIPIPTEVPQPKTEWSLDNQHWNLSKKRLFKIGHVFFSDTKKVVGGRTNPFEKICSSNFNISPGRGENIEVFETTT